jgi:hypothetical protein
MARRAAFCRALVKLRVWESQWQDLSYPEGDPRRAMFDNEQPQYLIDEREHLLREVVYQAALFGGELIEVAEIFADGPHHASNPYNIDRVRLADAIGGWLRPMRIGRSV